MLTKISTLFSNRDFRKLLENFFSLSALQGSVYFLNFITFPYLVRVLGPEKFGLVAFAQVLVQYLNMVTDYGFNLTATREISVNRENREKVSQIYSTVTVIKFFIFLITFAFLILLILLFEKFRSEWVLYIFAFGMVGGNVFFPVWFFQGLEKMKYTTILNVFAKLVFVLSIFILIKKPEHYKDVLLLNSLGFISAGLVSVWIVIKQFKVRFIFPDKNELLSQVKKGWYIFVSSVSINFYKSVDIFMLGLFYSDLLVGYYAISKKIIQFAGLLSMIPAQTIYPHVNKKIRESLPATVKFLKKAGFLISGASLAAGMLFLIFPGFIIRLVSGEAFHQSMVSLKLLAFVPLIVGINVPAVQLLLGVKMDKSFSGIVTYGAGLMVLLNLILIPIFSYIGAAVSVLIVELFVTIFLYLFIKKNSGEIKNFRAGDELV